MILNMPNNKQKNNLIINVELIINYKKHNIFIGIYIISFNKIILNTYYN